MAPPKATAANVGPALAGISETPATGLAAVNTVVTFFPLVA